MRFSENIKEISAALSKFQGDIKNLPKSANNPFFKSKYTPLDDILEYVRPILSKHGISVLQFPCSEQGKAGVSTLLTHSSGEWIEGAPYYLTMPKDDPQSAGGAITYARRYALASILGIASEDDDDGNGASGKTSPPKYQCCVCGKEISKSVYDGSMKANGKAYCTGTCKKKDAAAND